VTEVADKVKENPHQIHFSQVADLMHIIMLVKIIKVTLITILEANSLELGNLIFKDSPFTAIQ
jgi:hypothetical protein